MSKKYVCDFCLNIFENDKDLSLLFLQNPYYELFPKGIHICSSCYAALKRTLSDSDIKNAILSYDKAKFIRFLNDDK